jgi:alpha-N-arabinofuranosidase
MKLQKLASVAVVFLLIFLPACKVVVNVPEGGKVTYQDGIDYCLAGEKCILEVSDVFFDETFVAVPAVGYRFTGWLKGERGIFGNSTDNGIRLFTSNFAFDNRLLAILDSDVEFYLKPVFNTAPIVTRLDIDLSAQAHVISPLIFGDQNGWTNNSNYLYHIDSLLPDPDMMALLKEARPTIIRYPEGTYSDFFHWQEAVGPVADRIPQIDPFSSGYDALAKQVPYYGPDEYALLTQELGAEMLVTVNVGSGTAAEAAAWLSYYKNQNIHAKYWEVGNEVYYLSENYSYSTATVYKTALEYAAIFDEYSSALRAIDPSVEIGVLGVNNYPLFQLTPEADWNRIVLQNINEKADFVAVHNVYAPISLFYDDDSEKVFQSLLAAPEVFKESFASFVSDIETYASPLNSDIKLAVTEHAPFFINGDSDPMLQERQVEYNRTLASALFSALTFNVFVSEPRIKIAAHLKMNGIWFQTLVQKDVKGFSSAPYRSAYFHVFSLYRESAGGRYVPVNIQESPTYDAPAFGEYVARDQVDCLDAVSVVTEGTDVFLYVVNRCLDKAVEATLSFNGLSLGIATIVVDEIHHDDYTALNTGTNDNNVKIESVSIAPNEVFNYRFKAHSLSRFRLGF